MAMQVIRHGKKRVQECSNCECLFLYEKEDVESIKVGHNEYEHSIKCPDCGQTIYVDYFQ